MLFHVLPYKAHALKKKKKGVRTSQSTGYSKLPIDDCSSLC